MVALNQFGITPMVGDMVYAPNRPNMAVRVATGQSTALVAGQVVKLVDVASSMPVVSAAAVTDVPYGVVVRNERVTSFPANSICTIARDNDTMWMTSKTAIVAGAKLQFGVDVTVDDTATGGNTYIGRALTKAVTAGDLVQVEIRCNSTMQ